jgi:hypothetical protein
VLFEALHYAKTIDEETGAKIIEQFQPEQTALAQAIFAIFPGITGDNTRNGILCTLSCQAVWRICQFLVEKSFLFYQQ